MHLPETVPDDHCIDYDKDTVSVGDMMYYPPDGTVLHIVDSGPLSLEVKERRSGEHWKVSQSDVEDTLFSDFFPLKLTGHYPN